MVAQALAALVHQLWVTPAAVVRGRVSARPIVEVRADLPVPAVGREDAVSDIVHPLEL